MSVVLTGVQVENLRGFRSASLALDRPAIVLVGGNNSGKTSLLRLVDWAVNSADLALLRGQRPLTDEETELLIPRRDTRGGARRLTLSVRVADGRRWKRFNAHDGIARLRFRVRNDRVYLNVRTPSRSEPLGHEPNAIALLEELRASIRYVLIPAFRDVASDRFQRTLLDALDVKLRERAVHQAQGGAPVEYRQVKDALGKIKTVADRLVRPIWDGMHGEVLGLARDGTLSLEAEAGDLVAWMASRIRMRLITGDHDSRDVSPLEVGSGLQSLLDLAVLRGEQFEDGITTILAIEEPEAFLHPSAQRTLARQLLSETAATMVISTHSPVLVDEASYGQVLLVRDHKIFPPRVTSDERRDQINTALMNGQGAEALFARSVLLVEGEGDRLFFETLRRRLAIHDADRRTDQLYVVQAGSKASFAPWIRLLEGYHDSATGERPIEWLVVADGGDAASDVRRAFRDSGVGMPLEADAELRAVSQAMSAADHEAAIAATRRLNQAAASASIRLCLLPIDLEWAALQGVSVATLRTLQSSLGLPDGSLEETLRRLGSKWGLGPIADARKDPWMRSVVARELSWAEVSDDVQGVLRRWLRGCGMSVAEVTALFRKM